MATYQFDIPCPACGYNLRGLSPDNPCPECGVRIVSNAMMSSTLGDVQRVDAEIDANLREQTEAAARQERLDAVIDAWDQRGQRFDRLLDKAERLLDRLMEIDQEADQST